MKKLVLLLFLVDLSAFAQDNGYHTPPSALAELVTAKPTPTVSVDGKGEWMLLMQRNTATTTIAELSEPEFRLAGLRLNPATSGPSRATYINGLTLRRVPDRPTVQKNLGQKAQAATYQDLLKNPNDEKRFEYYTTSQAMKPGLDGTATPIGAAGMVATAKPIITRVPTPSSRSDASTP